MRLAGRIVIGFAFTAFSTAIVAAQDRPSSDDGGTAQIPEGDDDESNPSSEACLGPICAAEETEIAATLVQSGPQPGGGRDLDKPSAVGFTRNGWPVAIDFEPEPGTYTVFRVKLYHRRLLLPYFEVAYQQVLDPDGSGGRQTVVIDELNLADAGGDGVRVARYDVRSFRLSDDGELLRQGRRLVRAPVTVHGIGAGPNAVGSMTLRDVRLSAPSSRQIPAGNTVERIDFHYSLDRNFDAVAAFPRFCNPRCNDLPRIGPLPRLRSPRAQGQWTINRRVRPGNYELDVRAWLQCGGATAADALARCSDDAAWTFATARPFQLR